MKTLLVFLTGVAAGAFALYTYQQRGPSVASMKSQASRLPSTREVGNAASRQAGAFSQAFSRKLQDWHLTPADIHADLARTGEVVRENADRARERVSDVRIIAVIKAKYVLDRDLSAHAISVGSNGGDVTLAGHVSSEELVGRAVADALDTDGVRHVTSRLRVGTGIR